MGIAKLCTCGHTTADHLITSKGVRTRCDWFDCTCEKFIFNKTVFTGNKPTVDNTSILVRDHHNEATIGNLGDDGTVRL